jgi:hypothetical protein
MDVKLKRFCEICVEVGVDPKKLMGANMPVLPQLAQSWNNGEIDDVQLMRSIRNLEIFNPSIKIEGS